MKTYSIAENFSTTPGPRFKDEGEHSGELLREEYLLDLVRDAVENRQKLLIDLDGTHGYLTSFLEEAFGGLIRIDGFSYRDLKDAITFKSEEEPYLIEDIKEYLKEADSETR